MFSKVINRKKYTIEKRGSKGSLALIKHFIFVNWRIRGFILRCHEEVN